MLQLSGGLRRPGCDSRGHGAVCGNHPHRVPVRAEAGDRSAAGADTEFIRSRNLKDNPAYGKLREHTAKSLEELTGQLCENGYLQITGDYPVLSLTRKAIRTISSHSPVVVKTATSTQRYTVLAESDDLFEALRQTRRELASGHRIPAYAVFNDATLHAMAAKKPCTKSDMLRVQGVGM